VGTIGSFDIDAAGAWTFTANSAFDNLNTGDSVNETFNVTSVDGTTSTVQIAINGSNDSAAVSSASVTLDENDVALTTSGVLTSTDVDNDDNVFTAGNTVGTIGSFDIDAAGAWTFTANSAFDNLNTGDSVNETFNVTSVDGTTSTVQITINGSNDAPTLSNVITDQTTEEDTPFSFTVPANTFDDVDTGDTLLYSASLGDDSSLPSWLSFDADTQTFSGTPDNNDVNEFNVKVTATDTGGLSASDEFSFTVNNVNDAPVLTNPIADQATLEGEQFDYQLPANSFTDDDVIHGDVLTLSAVLADGSALPDWLTFDATTQTFTGTVPYDAAGEILVQVSATDSAGISVSDVFELNMINVLNGNQHKNVIFGTSNEDIINGFGGNDKLFGLADNDILNGGAGNDRLYGNEGNDELNGEAGNDKLIGGLGDDTLNGGSGNDKLEDWYGNNILDGGEGKDKLIGGYGDDQLFGGAGNDKLEDWYGNNLLQGGDGNDELLSGAGNDTLHGGAGFDWIEGGRGDDTYLFNLGDDIDIINEQQGEDILRFGVGINEDDLWFWRDNKDLNIGIIGTDDQITIEDWYKHNHHGWGYPDKRIEQFELSDGSALLENQVQQLVDAMASFSVPSSGNLDVPQSIQDDVQSVITTAWQAA